MIKSISMCSLTISMRMNQLYSTSWSGVACSRIPPSPPCHTQRGQDVNHTIERATRATGGTAAHSPKTQTPAYRTRCGWVSPTSLPPKIQGGSESATRWASPRRAYALRTQNGKVLMQSHMIVLVRDGQRTTMTAETPPSNHPAIQSPLTHLLLSPRRTPLLPPTLVQPMHHDGTPGTC